MKKILYSFFIITIFCGIIFLFYGNKNNKHVVKTDIKCDLNIKDCEILQNNEVIKFSFSPRPIRPIIPTSLKITGLDNLNEPSVVIKGVNMNMGEINADLIKKGKTYETTVVFNSCVDNMLYEIQIFEKNKFTGIKMQVIMPVR